MLKGYVKSFRNDADAVLFHEQKTHKDHRLVFDELKALFFVKTFSGYREYVEKKAFGIRENRGRKVYVKFSDKESLMGFIEGRLPWDRGYKLSALGKKAKGFFIVPADGNSNNLKVFVIGSAINDVTIMVV